jgi:PAS domain S-box-containing protein
MKFDSSLHEQILAQLPESVTIQDRDFKIIYQNGAIRADFGSHLGEQCFRVYEGREQACDGCGLQTVFATGKPTLVLRTVPNDSGPPTYWENSCFPLFDAGGEIVAGVEVCRDISARILLEAEVKERNNTLIQLNREYRTLLDHLPSYIVRYDRNLRRTYVNPAWESAAGLTAAECLGVDPEKLPKVKRPGNEKYRQKLRQVLATGRSQYCAFEWENAFGQQLYLEYEIIPESGPDGQVATVLAVGRDLTAYRNAENALRAQQRQAQSLLRLSQRLESAQSYSEAITAARDEVREILGYTNLWVYLFTEDMQYADVLAAAGSASADILAADHIARLTIAGDPMLEEIAAAKNLVVIEDARRDPRTNKEIVARLGNRTIINVPILLFKRHLGTLGTGTFGGEGVRIPTAAERDYLAAMASHMAVSLDRIRLLNESRQKEAALYDLNRKLRAISNCNQLLMRVEDEQVLLDEICRIICAEAGYLLAWVGYAVHDADRTVRPMAWAGRGGEYISSLSLTWAADKPQGQGPVGIALRTGAAVYVQDIASDLRMKPWRDKALHMGYRAGMALPLKDKTGAVFGALVVYYGEPDSITPDEIELLEELAGDLAFGLSVLRERRAREEARQQISLLSYALDRVREGAFLLDEEARLHYVNDEACRSLGYNRDELLALRVFDIDPDLSDQRWKTLFTAGRDSGSQLFETCHRSKDGRVFPVEIYATFLVFEGQGFSLALTRDISERKRVEEERQANLRFFESMDLVNRAVQAAIDPEQMMSAVLDRVLEIFGCDRASLIYPCDPEAATWQVPMERWRPEFPGLFARGTAMPMTPEVAAMHGASLLSERPLLFGGGTDYPLPQELRVFGDQSGLGMAIYPKIGSPWGFSLVQCTHPRIWSTEEVQLFEAIGRGLADGLTGLLSNRELRESREFLDNIVESLPSMLFVKDAATLKFVRFNQAGEQLLGYSRAELLGKNDYDFFPSEIADFFTANDRQVLDSKQALDIPQEKIRLRNNEERILHTQKIPLLNKRGEPQYLLGISEDITEHIKAEEELRKLTQAIEQSPVSIVITDVAGQIEFVNARYCQLTGYSRQEVLGQNPRLLKSGETPDADYRQLWKLIGSGRVWSGEFHNRKKNGELFWEHATIAPVCNADGEIRHYVAVKEDITARKRLEDQLHQAQKMESIGALAGGVAHDFNNMLAVILGRTQLALRKLVPEDPLYASLKEIQKAAEHSADLTGQLLAFARKQIITPQIIDLNAVLEGMLCMVQRLIGEDIQLSWAPGSESLLVNMDPSQLDQILVNLCVNARDALDGAGKIAIATRATSVDASFSCLYAESRPGDYVVLSVSDTGRGMDKETLAKIFEPFFTTKQRGQGTGLGLSTVYGIARQNRGFILVDSALGQGTTFYLYLPRKSEQSLPLTEAAREDGLPGGDETILVVEDETGILTMTRQMLEDFGYRVLVAASPDEALRLAEETRGKIHLLLTDLVMPGMNGQVLGRKLAGISPETRCLYMSGYPSNVIAHDELLDPQIHFIAKPFSVEGLLLKVRLVLDEPREGQQRPTSG